MAYRTEKDQKVVEAARQLNGTSEAWCEEYEKMISGMMYNCNDPKLSAARYRARCNGYAFNHADPRTQASNDFYTSNKENLKNLLGSIGERAFIEAPFTVDYGCNTRIGNRTFINFNMTILDVSLVTIGDRILFGPNVGIYTATHLTSVLSRNNHYEFGLPVTIEDDCWIGGDVKIMPGVTIGRGSTIGAGSVVLTDIPPFSVAVGTPAKVIKTIRSVEEERADPNCEFRESAV